MAPSSDPSKKQQQQQPQRHQEQQEPQQHQEQQEPQQYQEQQELQQPLLEEQQQQEQNFHHGERALTDKKRSRSEELESNDCCSTEPPPLQQQLQTSGEKRESKFLRMSTLEGEEKNLLLLPYAPRLSDYLSPRGASLYRPRPEWYTPTTQLNGFLAEIATAANNNEQDTLSSELLTGESLVVGVDRNSGNGALEYRAPEQDEEGQEQILPAHNNNNFDHQLPLIPNNHPLGGFLPAVIPFVERHQHEQPRNPQLLRQLIFDNEGVGEEESESDSGLVSVGVPPPMFHFASTAASPPIYPPTTKWPVTVFGRDYDPALHVAIRQDATEAALGLIEAGFPVDLENAKGVTPLLLASQKGNVTLVRALLQLGANPSKVSCNGSTAVLQASHFGHRFILQLLLARDSTLVEVANINQTTPLMRAAQEGHYDICTDLLRSGAAVNRRNLLQMSALMLSSQRGHAKICQLLIDYGADVDARTKQDSTSLLLACKRGHLEVVRVLVTAGCELWIKDSRGRTARHVAQRKDELLALLDSAVQVKLMQHVSRNVRSLQIMTYYHLLQDNRATVVADCENDLNFSMGIHEIQSLLAAQHKQPHLLPHPLGVPSTMALLRTMVLPPNLVEHICGYLPLPHLWPRRMAMLTRRATANPNAAVATALDLVDEILEEGGFLQACEKAGVKPPPPVKSWNEWKRMAQHPGPVDPSFEEVPRNRTTGLFGRERPVVTMSTVSFPSKDGSTASLIQMRRFAGYLTLLAQNQNLVSILQFPPYNLTPSLLAQLARCSDLASLVRRMGSCNGGIHFESTVAMDLVMLLSQMCAWYYGRESNPISSQSFGSTATTSSLLEFLFSQV